MGSLANSENTDEDIRVYTVCYAKTIVNERNTFLYGKYTMLPLSIVRPANIDWTCQTERCHTLSNETSLQ